MGSSLNLRGGTSVAKTLLDSITQSAHGFAVADVVRYDTTTSRYRKAIANSAENSEVVGIVSVVTDSNSFDLVYNGYVYLPSLAGASAPVQFLSGITAGEVTTNPPSAIGTVIKPVLTKNTSGGGYIFINYLGTQIGGSSTVAIDQIQPVGSIIPYAGGVIPETWLACNGASYAIGDYSELYTKLQYTTGSRTPMYGYVVEMQLSSGSAACWNATTVGDAFITNSTSTVPTASSYEIVGKVISKTATTLTGSHPLTVQVYPNYDDTTKNFIFPNKIPLPGQGAGVAGAILTFPSSVNTEPVVAVATGTARSVGTINTVSVIAFNTPDLRSRFPIGSGRTTRLAEQETNNDWFTSVGAEYTLGSMGGQESNRTTAVAATGGAVFVPFQATGSGSIPNIPPYVATQYIIKSKPYTRAAIIDGVDLLYDQLLVRDMRSESIGGVSGSDLVFYTNSGEADKLGTERMRLYNNGDLELLGDRNTARNRLFIKSTFNSYPGQTSNDDSYLESQKQDGTPVGNFGFNGWSNQSLRYTDFQIATRGVTDTEVNRRIYIDQDGNIQMGGWVGLTGGATGSNSRALTVTTTGDLYNDYQDKTYVSTGVTGGALRLSSNSSYSFIANNQYFEQGIGLKRSRAGGSSIIELWNTNDALGSRINFLVGGTGAKDSVISNKNAMSILPDGSLQIGEDGNAIAVAQPTTITRHHLFAQGSGSLVSGYGGKQTVVGDTWLIGEFTLGAPGDNYPMHCEMIVSSLVINSIDTTTYNFGAHYGAFDPGAGGWTPWCTLPVTHCSRYNTRQDIQSFRFDVRKKAQGNVQIRMRCTSAGVMYTNNQPINITFRTVAPSSVKFVPAAVGSAGNSVVATPLNGGSDLVAVPAGGYAGRHIYEFPVGDQFRPTQNGLFVNEWGMTHVRSNMSEVFRVESLDPGTQATSVMTWYRNGTPCGYVQMYGDSITLVTTSDHRLKNNVHPLVSALDKISKLNPVSFNWIKGDEPDTGFIAHEVQSVIPNAAFGEKDAVNEDGSILTQSVSSEKLIAWLVAGMKELKTIVDTQSAEITALKAKMGM